MTRILAVDWGERRIGLAVGDWGGRLARTLPTAAVTGFRDAVRAVSEAARREGAGEILVGLPLLPSGSEGESARRVRKLGAALAARGFTVRYRDERHTSQSAEDLLRERSRAPFSPGAVDAVAAALLLQDYLDEAPRHDDS